MKTPFCYALTALMVSQGLFGAAGSRFALLDSDYVAPVKAVKIVKPKKEKAAKAKKPKKVRPIVVAQPELHQAARLGKNYELQELLKAGKDMKWADSTGATPVYWAAAYGREESLKILMNHNIEDVKACLAVKASLGKNPLHRAAGSSAGCMALLAPLASFDQINAKDVYGSTPLLWAVSQGNYEAAKILLERCANVNVQDKMRHRSPLHWALRMKEGVKTKGGATIPAATVLGLVQLLLDYGVNTTLLDHQNRTAADWARDFNYSKEYWLITGERLPKAHRR